MFSFGPASQRLTTLIALSTLLALGGFLDPSRLEAQEAEADSSSTGSSPRLTRTDWFILGGGTGLALFSQLALTPRVQEVPPTGLDRADIVFEIRDATGFTPTGKKHWWEELPPADAGSWGERAGRRKGRKHKRNPSP